MNNSTKYTKHKYFNDIISLLIKRIPLKTWQLINELNSRQPKKKVIVEIENIESSKINSAFEMADALNSDFGNVGHNLARGKPNVDTQPENGFISTENTSFKSCSANEVLNLFEKLEVKKASGLDNLPSKFLKIVADSGWASKNLVRSQLKPSFKILSVLF